MSEEKRLAILGLKGAGKSTFIAVLQWALSDPDFPSKWRITPADDSTNNLVFELENWIFTKNLYPPRTNTKSKMEFIAEKNQSLGGIIPGGSFRIIAGDVPGENVLGLRGDAESQNFYKDYLENTSAVIFLVDPEELWKTEGEEHINYFPLFRSILTEIKQQTPSAFLAFGATKIDNLPKDKYWGKGFENIYNFALNQDIEKAEALIAETIGQRTFDWIEHNFDRKHVSWWLVSATGFIDDNKGRKVTQHIELDGEVKSGIKDPEQIKPIGVLEIVEWALDKIAVDAEKNRPLISGKPGKAIEEFVRDKIIKNDKNG